MRTIAFCGGGLIAELGPVSDVALFFDCINAYVVLDEPNVDWSPLTDKLYRRYVDLESLTSASKLMAQVKAKFHATASTAVSWDDSMLDDAAKTELDRSKPTLGQVFNNAITGSGSLTTGPASPTPPPTA